jgi:hypothetical protein
MKSLCRYVLLIEHSSTLLRAQAMDPGTDQRDEGTQIHLAPQKTHRRRGCALVTHRATEAETLSIVRSQYLALNTAWLTWIVGHIKLASAVRATLVANLLSDIPIEQKKSVPEAGIQRQ